jgi:peptide-N4-(N-acetyl-beta-glucosaminyl)asparagine amidase
MTTTPTTPTTPTDATKEAIARVARRTFASLEPELRRQRERFEQRLRSGIDTVMKYEDDVCQVCALSVMPVEELRAKGRALASGGAVTDAVPSVVAEATEPTSTELAMSVEDGTLLALLAWFKNDFFTWVNAIKCEKCDVDMTYTRTDSATTDEEREGQAGRVEVYSCASCSALAKFPRFNSPVKLLETRRGRCGEWANAFTLCARAMGYRARWCLDWTDHVWTEVWSENQRAWLHCDSCENVCDKPLLYEQGWGKKLTYVIAFSVEGIVDVTRRYVKDMNVVRPRRGEVYEVWLKQTLKSLTDELRIKRGFLPDEIQHLEREDAREQEELSLDAKDVGESLPGRRSGSIAWRRARGELGNDS